MTTLRTIPVLVLVAGALAAPAAAQAGTTPTDQHNAAQECRLERGGTDATRAAFALRYGTNHNHSNAFGKCVAAKAQARKTAANRCGGKHGRALGKCIRAQEGEDS